MPYLPDVIPAHYGTDHQVTRWGSKYETLILPVIVVFFGIFMLGMAKLASKQEGNGKSNEKVCLVTGIFSLLLFNAMTIYFLYTSFNKVENLSSVTWDINRVVFGLLGVFMIVIGNIMPKLRKNSIIGLRTSWSMKNEITWKKSQRFGGISFVIGGIVTVFISLLTKGTACLICAIGIGIIILFADICYTYRISKKY